MERLPGKKNLRPRVAVSFIVLVTLVALFWFAHRADVAEEELKKTKPVPHYATPENREAWLTVVQERTISEYETVRLIQVNSSILGFSGTECLLYTNAAYRTSQLVCSK